MSCATSRYRNNVAAVVMDADGYVLLGRKKDTGRYRHFPQGGVGKKELLEDALWRELQEEVGLSAQGLRIVSQLAGLRYDYRAKNKKRKDWDGQEQTYYLIRSEGRRPVVCCDDSPEFGLLEWVHYRELTAEMFVPFKRGVVEQVLAFFFPDTVSDVEAHLSSLTAAVRYEFDEESSLLDYSPIDRTFFAGGKQDAQVQMEDLKERIRSAQKRCEALCVSRAMPKQRTLVLLHDAETVVSKRRLNCLRRISELFDPLLTEVQKPVDMEEVSCGGHYLTPCLSYMMPRAGETLLTANSVYQLFGICPDSRDFVEFVADFEQMFCAEDTCVFKFFLNITPEQSAYKFADFEKRREEEQAVLRATAGAVPWYVVPAEKKWYRDFVIASIVAQTLENRLQRLEKALPNG